jgi:chorismate mutase
MRIYVQQGQAYRRAIEEAQLEAARARADLDRFVSSLVPTVWTDHDWSRGSLRILIELDQRLYERSLPNELVERLRNEIFERLLGLGRRDHRGDLRQTPAQRALGLYSEGRVR